MTRNLQVLMIVFGLTSAAFAAGPGTLTSLHAIHSLRKTDAARNPPVAFEATITYYNRGDVDLFVQDGKEAIYVETKPNQALAAGDRVLVQGVARDSFRPDVRGDLIKLLRHGDLPKPVKASFARLIHADLDCMLVTVRATVRSADTVNYGNLPGVDLKLLMDGGYIDGTVLGSDAITLQNMLDADVEVTGVASGLFDSKTQLTGILLEVPSFRNVKVLKRAKNTPESLPITPMDEVLAAYHVRDSTQRVRVQGTITYYEPGSAVVLQNGTKSLWITTQFEGPLQIGDQVDATGFPGSSGDLLTLTHSEIRERHVSSPIAPLPITTDRLTSGLNAFDLVSVEGQVLMAVREAAQDEYVLASNGALFSAIYRHPDTIAAGPLPPMKQIDVGSRVRVSGICMLQYGSDPFHGPVAVDLLLRSFDDISVTAAPSILNVTNLTLVVALLLAAVLAVGARGWSLERRMRLQTDGLAARIEAEAALERRRSRILEDINGSRPLEEILRELVSMTSAKLGGAPCWCQVRDGSLVGDSPADLGNLRVIRQEILSHTGPNLGELFVAIDPKAVSAGNEQSVLEVASRLAVLAIETRRLYSDLVHRSEFDLLTDLHNRFSLEKQIDTLIHHSEKSGGTFGLIFIDLDNFKQVNDRYGHRAGDLFLQGVAMRMKHQLRGGDLLARLGGDEFAALTPHLRARSEVEDVAQRLERCFDDPVEVEGSILRGTASIGIALYPDDGLTRDSLLSRADTAMYAAKNTRRQFENIRARGSQ